MGGQQRRLRVIDKEMAWDWLKSLGKYNSKKPARRLLLLNSGVDSESNQGHGDYQNSCQIWLLNVHLASVPYLTSILSRNNFFQGSHLNFPRVLTFRRYPVKPLGNPRLFRISSQENHNLNRIRKFNITYNDFIYVGNDILIQFSSGISAAR